MTGWLILLGIGAIAWWVLMSFDTDQTNKRRCAPIVDKEPEVTIKEFVDTYNSIGQSTLEYSRVRNRRVKPTAEQVQKAGEIKNVAGKCANPCSWFVVDRAQNNPMSPAEKIIAEQLDLYNIEWYKEVAFEGLKFTDWGFARYDFLLVVPGGIQLIEYDSVKWHNNPDAVAKDKIKTEFCRKHQIPLIRYSAVHYYKMGYEISKLMNSYGITKKSRK